MKIKLNLNAAATVERIKAAADAGLYAMVETAMEDASEFVPHGETGNLKSKVIINREPGKAQLVWESPQARYLYYGLLMISPSTGSAWAKKGETKVIKKPIKELNLSKGRNSKARKLWAHYAENQYGKRWKEVLQQVFKLNMEKGRS